MKQVSQEEAQKFLNEIQNNKPDPELFRKKMLEDVKMRNALSTRALENFLLKIKGSYDFEQLLTEFAVFLERDDFKKYVENLLKCQTQQQK